MRKKTIFFIMRILTTWLPGPLFGRRVGISVPWRAVFVGCASHIATARPKRVVARVVFALQVSFHGGVSPIDS
jgi:hypothetical protein